VTRINHSQEFVDGKNHINDIENFWSQAERILRKRERHQKRIFSLVPQRVRAQIQWQFTKTTTQKYCEIGVI